jgi:hypothetical protein
MKQILGSLVFVCVNYNVLNTQGLALGVFRTR